MMMVEDEKFFAWLDGELPPEEAAAMEQKVATDPELSRAAAEHRALAASLRDAFAPIAETPAPDQLRRAVSAPPSNVVQLKPREALRAFGGVSQWAAMAATLALGVFAGSMIDFDTDGPVAARGGEIYAAGAIDQALDTQLASAGAVEGIRVLLTFRDRSGTICRTFESASSSGLACNEAGGWRVKGLFAAPEGSASEFRMAAGPDPRLMDMVDSAIAGEPFDAARERSARDSDWR